MTLHESLNVSEPLSIKSGGQGGEERDQIWLPRPSSTALLSGQKLTRQNIKLLVKELPILRYYSGELNYLISTKKMIYVTE
jgi:hypothetical protein